MNSLADRDTLRAGVIFGFSLFVLILCSFFELTTWPGQPLLSVIANPSMLAFFLLLNGYALNISILFWGSRPSLRSQYFTIVAWPMVSLALWQILRGKISFDWGGSQGFDILSLLSAGMAIPAFIALLWRVWRPATSSDIYFEANFRWLLLMMLLFFLVQQSALNLTVSLHPQTFDIFAMKFDAAAGLAITPWLSDTITSLPGVAEILETAYGLTPLAFFALALLQLRNRPAHLPNALLLWVVMTLCAVVSYQVFPITGPKYAFGANEFISTLRDPSVLQLQLTTGAGPNPRNGMPSMHFGWMLATLVVWSLSGTRRWSMVFLAAMTICVALATLYLGEHYVIDLVVAVPFVLACIALCTTSVPWAAAERWRAVAMGFGCWLAWIILLRTQIDFFVAHGWACWVLLAFTAAAVTVQALDLSRLPSRVPEITPLVRAIDSTSRISRYLGLMFFVSGLAALVYQVVFAKELALVFGSTATATFTVLATFLGGMAVGSLIGGSLAQRVSKPVIIYAAVELAIGAFCIATPLLFSVVQSVYIFLAADLPPASPTLLVLRIALGAGVLFVPTVLMGITLPLLAQALNSQGEKLGGAIARLYTCNTAGAAVGALLAGYAVIPLLGVNSTILIAAFLNCIVALGALKLAKGVDCVDRLSSLPVANVFTAPIDNRVFVGACVALCFGGIFSLGLEVIYVHLLSIVAGNSVYAFSLMLATFLTGLALGGGLGKHIITYSTSYLTGWLAVAQILLAFFVVLGTWGWDMIPAYFASFAGYPLLTSFASHEAVRGIVCALVMIPPTVCIGLSYTLAMDLVTSGTTRRGRMLGVGTALNTFGNIAGVLLFGFVLLPWFGGLIASKVLAIGSLVIAFAVLLSLTKRSAQWQLGAVIVAVAGLAFVSPTRLNYELLSSGANVYFQAQNWGAVIGHAESIDGGLTTVTVSTVDNRTIKTLLTNGKFQGNDARKGEVQAQIGFAALPLLHQDRRDNALIIGYGTGATARVFHDAGFTCIDIAELSRDVIELANTHFSKINNKVSHQVGVQTHITDGRNFLLLTPKKYDIISTEITSIWFAGAASFYNREFYQLVRSKLTLSGVFQQWVQLHHMATTDLLTIVGTLRSEFSFVSLYVVGGQGILIATNDPAHAEPLPAVLADLDQSPRLESVRDLAGRRFSDIANDLLLSPTHIDVLLEKIAFGRGFWISTDKNLRLEYSTPKANATLLDRSFETNMALLRSANSEIKEEKQTKLTERDK